MPDDAKIRADKRAAQVGAGLTPEPLTGAVPDGAHVRAERRAAQVGAGLTPEPAAPAEPGAPEPGEAGPGQ